jgi:hypothetical protein
VTTEDVWAQWWKARGRRELALILWARWDPIGVGVPSDEYDLYTDQIGALLRQGADEHQLSEYLRDTRRARMELPQPRPNADDDAAEKIVIWYAEVWEDPD